MCRCGIFQRKIFLLSILFLIELINKSDTNDSQTLDKVGVNECARRKSVVMSAGTDVFGIGIAFSFFHTVGTCCCCIEALKSEITGKVKIHA